MRFEMICFGFFSIFAVPKNMLSLFYYRFVDSLAGLDEQWWTHNFNSHAVESWQGLSFELISLLHLNQIKQKLGIAGISTSASSWRYVPSKKMGDGIEEKGAQIDLFA